MTEETKTPPVHVRTIRVEIARAGEHELEITATLVDERPSDNPRWFGAEPQGAAAVARVNCDRANARGCGTCDTAVTPVHKGAGRKRVAIDPPEAVAQGTQRVVPLQPELW